MHSILIFGFEHVTRSLCSTRRQLQGWTLQALTGPPTQLHASNLASNCERHGTFELSLLYKQPMVNMERDSLTETMTVDESFKKSGAVPFKWEIRPGVPKIRTDLPHRHHSRHPESQGHGGEEAASKHSLSPPRRLKPPPAGFQFRPQEEHRSRSFRSAPRARSERWRVDLPVLALARPIFTSPGCFPASPIFNRKENSGGARRPKAKPEPDPDYLSELDKPTRRSVSSRKSVSPFRDSPSSSYFSFQSSPRLSISSYLSDRSSPQHRKDADWAGFGLF